MASNTESGRRVVVPVGTPPILGVPRDVRGTIPAPQADVPRQRGADEDAVPATSGATAGATATTATATTATATATGATATGGAPGAGMAGFATTTGGAAAQAGPFGDTAATGPAHTPFSPPAVDADAASAAYGRPVADATGAPAASPLVGLAAFGARPSSAFDPQAPQPLPERIRPLVGALITTASRIGLKLTLACGRRVDVSCAGCGRLPASALAGSGAAWSVVDAGLPTPGVLTADDPVALALADVLLGGDGKVAPRAPERVEISVLRRHLGRALSPLVEPLAPYGVRVLDLAAPPPEITAPELLGGAEMFAVRLSVELDSGELPGVLVLALPYRTLFGTAGTADVPRDEKANRALSAVPVDLTVRFPATTLPAYDVAGLEPGDVLRLDVASPVVQGLVDGVRLLSGSLGRSGRRRAILVSELEAGLEAGQ